MKKILMKKKTLMLTGIFMILLLVGVSLRPSTVKADSGTFRVNGRTYYISNDMYSTVLYQKTGYNYRLVASIGKNMNYKFSYGNKLYFSGGGEWTSCYTYSYTVGKKGFNRVGSFFLKSHRSRYAIGYTDIAGDPSPSSLCMFNLSSRKLTRIGKGCDIKFIGNKIYYAAVKNKYTMQIIRRNANGCGKRVLKTIKTSRNNKLTYVGNITKHSVKCYIISKAGWKIKIVRF